LPSNPKVARDTIMVGWPLRLPASVESPSGMNESTMPAKIATTDWLRLRPSPNTAAPKPMLSIDEFEANHSQNCRAALPTR
jgi:hypothetical protein